MDRHRRPAVRRLHIRLGSLGQAQHRWADVRQGAADHGRAANQGRGQRGRRLGRFEGKLSPGGQRPAGNSLL